MTLPPEKIGDKGQRFEILYIERAGGAKIMGWAGTFDGAKTMRDAWRARPSRPFTWINDREGDEGTAIGAGVPVDEWPIEIEEVVEIFVVHQNAQYAVDVEDLKLWQGWLPGKWIDHNGGGWTWEGLCGRVTHVRPIFGDAP